MTVSDSLKTKLNMCVLILFLFFCLIFVLYISHITYVCTFLSYKYTTYRLLDWKATLEGFYNLWIRDDPAYVFVMTEATLF